MIALGVVQAGLIALALLFSLQDPGCAALAGDIFGPDFTKAYNAPTDAEKKALEEQAAKAKLMDKAGEFSGPAMSKENLSKTSSMDFSGIDKAIATAPNEGILVADKFAMLVAAGRTDEANDALARMGQINTAEANPQIDARARTADDSAYALSVAADRIPPNDPAQARIKAEMCNQVKFLNSLPNRGGFGTSQISSDYYAKYGC